MRSLYLEEGILTDNRPGASFGYSIETVTHPDFFCLAYAMQNLTVASLIERLQAAGETERPDVMLVLNEGLILRHEPGAFGLSGTVSAQYARRRDADGSITETQKRGDPAAALLLFLSWLTTHLWRKALNPRPVLDQYLLHEETGEYRCFTLVDAADTDPSE